uniref:Uncharacterized protein n=1 Tax=Trichobilharzia regenti TaxID=157069 RepID=A0AA85JRW1_TRIRE|nr:unnamed protein product [Trichobilharzia regenti]
MPLSTLILVISTVFLLVLSSATYPPSDENLKFNKSQANNSDFNEIIAIKTITSVPLLHLVDYLWNQSETKEMKVKTFSIPSDSLYTHIYYAWKEADQHMSSVALKNDEIVGANLVVPIEILKEMYAPEKIAAILDFAIHCYAWAKPDNIQKYSNPNAYVSILRGASNTKVNQQLIRETTKYFLISAQYDAYHFVWENSSLEQTNFMSSLNYTQIVCGDSKLETNPCDWKTLGMDKLFAEQQCLYRIINNERTNNLH